MDAPADARVYEAEVVIPGMIDAHAHLALDRSSQSRIPGPVTAEWKAVEHLDLEDPMIQVALSGGITSLITRSGSGIISSGQSVALKMKSTPGPEMIFKPYVDLKMAVRPLINLRPERPRRRSWAGTRPPTTTSGAPRPMWRSRMPTRPGAERRPSATSAWRPSRP